MVKQVLVVLESGFEETEYIAVRDALIRSGIDVYSVSLTGDKLLTANHNTKIMADFLYSEILNNLKDCEALFIPGGLGVEKLDKNPEFDLILDFFISENKIVGSICAAPYLLAKRGLLKNREAVVYPDKKYISYFKKNHVIYRDDLDFVGDGPFFTGKNMEVSIEFGFKFAMYIKNQK